MMRNDLWIWLFVLSLSGFMGFGISTLSELESKTEALQARVAALELKSLKQNRVSFVSVSPPSTQTAFKNELYSFFQKINGVQTVQDVSKPKRILLLEKTIRVSDFEVVREDAFFDLLGRLLDEDLFDHFLMPDPSRAPKESRAFLRSLKQELVRFGIPDDQIQVLQGAEITVFLKRAP